MITSWLESRPEGSCWASRERAFAAGDDLDVLRKAGDRRSGLTYQAALLEKAGLVTRGPSPDDERATLVTITGSGLALLDRVMPGHVEVARRLLLDPLSDDDLRHLGDIMTCVRDHMRARPPRSAAPRKCRPAPASPGPEGAQDRPERETSREPGSSARPASGTGNQDQTLATRHSQRLQAAR
jgi:hypothetical protein